MILSIKSAVNCTLYRIRWQFTKFKCMEFENIFTISTMNLLETYGSDLSYDKEDFVVGAPKPRTTSPMISAKPPILPLIKKAIFSSCKTDFSRHSSLIIENYDVSTMQLHQLGILTHLVASLVAEESTVVEKYYEKTWRLIFLSHLAADN